MDIPWEIRERALTLWSSPKGTTRGDALKEAIAEAKRMKISREKAKNSEQKPVEIKKESY